MLVARSIPSKKEQESTHVSRYNRIKVWHIYFWINIVQIPCKIFTLKAVLYFKSFWKITKWFLEKDEKEREALIKTALIKYFKWYYLYLSLGIKKFFPQGNARWNLTAFTIHQATSIPTCSFLASKRVRYHCGADLVLFYPSFVPQTCPMGQSSLAKWYGQRSGSWEHSKLVPILYPKMICKMRCEKAGVEKQCQHIMEFISLL